MGSIDFTFKKQKLLRFLAKEIPSLLPWVGEIWKDAVEEFTQSDIDKALERIESYQERDSETQKQILVEILLLRLRMELQRYRMKQLKHLLDLNWGNSRFLFALQLSEKAFVFNFNVDKEFREGFLDILDATFAAPNSPEPPFAFPRSGTLIAFPQGYESYQHVFRNPNLERPSVPTIIEEYRVIKDGNAYYAEGAHPRPLPSLPTRSGFICGWDDEVGLPTKAGDEPCPEFYGAYYWVRPYGLRTCVHAIGVLDPLECRYGTAIWWGPDDSRPFIGAILGKRITEETRKEVHQATVQNYIEMMKRYSEGLRRPRKLKKTPR